MMIGRGNGRDQASAISNERLTGMKLMGKNDTFLSSQLTTPGAQRENSGRSRWTQGRWMRLSTEATSRRKIATTFFSEAAKIPQASGDAETRAMLGLGFLNMM
jgi:hypothetical protein